MNGQPSQHTPSHDSHSSHYYHAVPGAPQATSLQPPRGRHWALLLLSTLLLAPGCFTSHMPSFFDRPRNASDDVRRLIASLYNPDPLVRADACEKLQERADAEPAMPYLLGLLYDDTVAWNPMALSTDPRTEVGNEAAMALANIGGPAVQPLITIMGSNAPIRVRTRAARGLGYARARPAIPALVRALDTNDAMLHHVCIQALQAITFERFTEDQDWRDWLKKQTPPATSPASQPGKA